MSNWSDEETNNPLLADQRNYYKVEKWTKVNRVEHMLFAGSNLDTGAVTEDSSFRTLLCIIFSSAARGRVKQRSVRTKFQSGDVWLRTKASASSRCVAAAQYSV